MLVLISWSLYFCHLTNFSILAFAICLKAFLKAASLKATENLLFILVVDCDFDDNICGWNNFHINDQFDWDRKSGSAASQGTGPSADHTKGDSTGWLHFF